MLLDDIRITTGTVKMGTPTGWTEPQPSITVNVGDGFAEFTLTIQEAQELIQKIQEATALSVLESLASAGENNG